MNYSNNKYDQYNVNDWVVDDDFISYVNGSDNPTISKLEENPAHLENINEAKAIVSGLGNSAPYVSDHKLEAIFDKINLSIDESPIQVSKTRVLNFRNAAWTAGIAAAITLLIIFIPGIQNSNQTFATNIGEKESITLPDNSKVELNNDSEIVYDDKEWDRNLTLKGEAFFKVEKGSKFTVSSAQGRVSVLGTQFNIYDRANYYEVECLEGRVQVDLEDGGSFILNAGDKLSDFNNKQNPIVKKNVVKKIDWLNKFVQVDSMDLGFVFDELGRYYDVDFVNDTGIRGKSYAGFFTTASLDSAVYQILWPLGIDYSIEGKKVIIK